MSTREEQKKIVKYDWTKDSSKTGKITFEKVLEDYSIEEKELEQICREFSLTKSKIPKKLLDELVNITITTPMTDHSFEQTGHFWYRIGWVLTGIKYGDTKWVTKHEALVIDRLAIPWIDHNDRKVRDRDGSTIEINTKKFKRFNVSQIMDFNRLKRKK